MNATSVFKDCAQSLYHPAFLRPRISENRGFAVCCKASMDSPNKSKGFGSDDGRSKGSNHAKGSTKKASKGRRQRRIVTVQEGSPALKKILKEIEKGKLDIDPEDAIKGKVDFARVETWEGLGLDKQVEDLKMKSFSPSFTSLDQDIPLYEQLVQRLQLLDAKGDIAVVRAKPLPPFEKWLFGEQHYLQFLIDQALKADIESIFSVVAFKCREQNVELPKPITQAVAYAKYLQRLGNIASYEENGKEACLNLFSHLFSVHVTHLTTGMRIGAKAMDCLPCLLELGAVGFYRDYPQQASNPLEVFMATVNRAGGFLISENDREQVMSQLPKAIQKTGLLLAVLAVE